LNLSTVFYFFAEYLYHLSAKHIVDPLQLIYMMGKPRAELQLGLSR